MIATGSPMNAATVSGPSISIARPERLGGHDVVRAGRRLDVDRARHERVVERVAPAPAADAEVPPIPAPWYEP